VFYALPESFHSSHNQRILNPEPNPYRRGAHLIQFRSPEGERLMLQIAVGIVTTWKRKPMKLQDDSQAFEIRRFPAPSGGTSALAKTRGDAGRVALAGKCVETVE
jgi:hypothetical protein